MARKPTQIEYFEPKEAALIKLTHGSKGKKTKKNINRPNDYKNTT
jgi:hypothetical protein